MPTKAHLLKALVFLVVMYGCESWTVKNAERVSNLLAIVTNRSNFRKIERDFSTKVGDFFPWGEMISIDDFELWYWRRLLRVP